MLQNHIVTFQCAMLIPGGHMGTMKVTQVQWINMTVLKHESTVPSSFVKAFRTHQTCITYDVLFVCFIHNKELDRGQTSLIVVLILRWIRTVNSCQVSTFTIVCLKWCKTTQELSSKWTTNKRGICISLIHVVRGYSPYVVYGHKWYEYLYYYP